MFTFERLVLVFPYSDRETKAEIDKILIDFYQLIDVEDKIVLEREAGVPSFFNIDPDIYDAISKKAKELGKDIIMSESFHTDEKSPSDLYLFIYKKEGEIIHGPELYFNVEDTSKEKEVNEKECKNKLRRLCKKHGLNIPDDDILWSNFANG